MVGIDGSNAAIHAAKWAVAEAVSQNVPLRLIHAIPEQQADAPATDVNLDIEYGQSALRAASAVVHAMGQPVDIEANIVHVSPSAALIDQSRNATMVCVGSVGIGRVARKLLGSTAETVAKEAQCPVAVIRAGHDSSVPASGAIAVIVDDSESNDSVLDVGFREAELRTAPILALGAWRWGFGEIPYTQMNDRLSQWVTRYPDVHVRPAAARHGVAKFLTSTQDPVQLAVVGSEDANDVARIVGPIDPHFGHTGRSVLVVRG